MPRADGVDNKFDLIFNNYNYAELEKVQY